VSTVTGIAIRLAGVEDAEDVARLLFDFNTEFEEPTAAVGVLSERARQLLAEGEMTALLVGDPPHGMAMLRFRPSIWTWSLDAYLEELYVAPPQRGKGFGRALLEGAMETARRRGALHFDLTTGETDAAARALYESLGFTNREGSPEGPAMLYYERDL
jgi:ribosomal protein S18 acetylase RimI-like enzyme